MNGDSAETREFQIFHRYSEQPIVLKEISAILTELDALFDRINLPQASTEKRVFEKKERSPNTMNKGVAPVMAVKDVSERKGNKGTFVVHVQYRQNATWQGNVVWAEKNITQNFRSALELLKLIDSALDAEEEE